MLVLHGGFDPTMPLSRARDRAQWLEGALQHFVEVPEAHHVTLNHGDCPASLYAGFLADPSAPLDTSCVATMPRLGFAARPEVDVEIWGVADRWGMSGCTTGGAPSLLALPLLPLLLTVSRRRPDDSPRGRATR